MLLEKMVEALLTTATQPTVRAKKGVVQEEVSTFTSTVITRKTPSMTKREDRIRTLAGTLGTRGRSHSCVSNHNGKVGHRRTMPVLAQGAKKTKRGGRKQ